MRLPQTLAGLVKSRVSRLNPEACTMIHKEVETARQRIALQ